jgi:hypothetical protein
VGESAATPTLPIDEPQNIRHLTTAGSRDQHGDLTNVSTSVTSQGRGMSIKQILLGLPWVAFSVIATRVGSGAVGTAALGAFAVAVVMVAPDDVPR